MMERGTYFTCFTSAFVFMLVLAALISSPAFAMTVTVTQPGADSDEVMKGRVFTVEASGWSGACSQATISFTDCSVCSLLGEDTQKTISGNSVTWTTVVASQTTETPQKIWVSVSGGCTMEQDDSNEFYVVLPPDLDVSVSPQSVSLTAGSTFDVNINIYNGGETAARNVDIDVSGTGMSVQSGCSSIPEIGENENYAQGCVIKASTPGTYTATFTVSPSNADDVSDSVIVTVSGGGGGGDEGGEHRYVGAGGPGAAPPGQNKSKKINFVPPGLINNTKLLAAIEKVLGKGKLSEVAKQNLIEKAGLIRSSLDARREFEYSMGKSRVKTMIKYSGKKKVKNFMLYETLPKTFAEHASNVTVNAQGARVEVVESDPSWLIVFRELNPGESILVEYETSGQKSSSVIDDVTTELYVGGVEEAGESVTCNEGEKRCYGDEIQECRGDAWRAVETCEYGCEDGRCKEKPFPEKKAIEKPSEFLTMPIIFGIAVVFIVLGVSVWFFKKRKSF